MGDVGGEQPQPGEAQVGEGGVWQNIVGVFRNALFFYFAVNLATKFLGGGGSSAPGSVPDAVRHPVNDHPGRNVYTPLQPLDLQLFLSSNESHIREFSNPIWHHKFAYGDWTAGPASDGSFNFFLNLPTPQVILGNGSLYLHAYVFPTGGSADPTNEKYSKRHVVHGVHRVNKFRKRYYAKTTNLLTGKSESSAEDLRKAEVAEYEILNHWHPNLTINLLADYTMWTRAFLWMWSALGAVPPPLDEFILFDDRGDTYLPILLFNDYWNLARDYQPINASVTSVNFSITLSPISMIKWQLYVSQKMQKKWNELLKLPEGGDEEDSTQDQIKEALLETSPALLAVTVLASCLHTVFEFLAFKNDIQFWRSRDSLAGLSVRTVLFSIFQSAIIFLYICDNDTNLMVKFSVFVGMLIECWKIPKVLDVTVDYAAPLLGFIPRVRFADRGSYVESDTKVYDDLAFRYLSWLLFPLFVGYAFYSLIYEEHRGWYSWLLNMLYGFLLTFGFISMTPQLFINYKLKSVAHLPWRMLSYKFLNTFIDDLFAFVIRMPTLYRIGCFRDDIIFLIYLYQRWIYRVDPTRTNEFGTSLEKPSATAPALSVAASDEIPVNDSALVPKGAEEKKND